MIKGLPWDVETYAYTVHKMLFVIKHVKNELSAEALGVICGDLN